MCEEFHTQNSLQYHLIIDVIRRIRDWLTYWRTKNEISTKIIELILMSAEVKFSRLLVFISGTCCVWEGNTKWITGSNTYIQNAMKLENIERITDWWARSKEDFSHVLGEEVNTKVQKAVQEVSHSIAV